MNTYRLRVRPIPRLAHAGWYASALSSERLMAELAGASVRGLSGDDSYHWLVDLQLGRETHEEALNEIFIALQRLGFEVVNAWVTEWADRAVQGALLGFAGGGTAGSASRNADLTAIIALAAGVIGGLVGSQLKRVEKVYELTPSFPDGWVLTPVPLQEPGEPVLRPGFSLG
jgi:hypothetical protein